MRRMPKLGERVRYSGKWQTMKGVVGVVVKLYPGYVHLDDEEGDITVEPAVAVKVLDKLPENWPYPGTDCFAPSITDVEPDEA